MEAQCWELKLNFQKIKKNKPTIGNFFRQLDETIALQSAEVEKLNQLKKRAIGSNVGIGRCSRP